MRPVVGTLSRHIAWRFAKAILLVFVICLILATLIDFSELARRSFDGVSVDLRAAALIALLRAPSLGHLVLPFAVLFGALATLVALNRRLEITVAKAAGVSAWQILLPGAGVAFLIGVVAITAYNPGAAALRELAVGISGAPAGGSFSGSAVWLRQTGNDGPSIIGADRSAEGGAVLGGVRAFVFAPDGSFRFRLDAPRARLDGHEWIFSDATLTQPAVAPAPPAEYRLHTSLSLTQIHESLVDPDSVPFWRLPDLIALADAAALPATALRLHLQELLATPLLLMAMVLIAGVVSLRFSRTLGIGRLVVAGTSSGFVLYVVLEVSQNFGRGGVVSPVIAAWAPAILATLISVTLLLIKEDG